jgi:hypothetical protein
MLFLSAIVFSSFKISNMEHLVSLLSSGKEPEEIPVTVLDVAIGDHPMH